MYVPSQLVERIEALSARLGSTLAIVRCWKSERGRPVLYCDFRGTIHKSPELILEVAGTLCAELTIERQDEIDLFLFVNGQRVGLYKWPSHGRQNESFKYLIGHGDAPFVWDYNDEGFDQFDTLDSNTYSTPIDKSLVIHPPERSALQDDE